MNGWQRMVSRSWLLALLLAGGWLFADGSVQAAAAQAAPQEVAAQEAAAQEAPATALPNERRPQEGLLTGGQPTPEALAKAAEDGYKTVINLRPADEEGAWDEAPVVRDLGLDYVAIPVAGAADVTEENARKLAEVLADPERYPVVIHCASGNRVGALLALKAFHVDGADAETALQLGRDAGLTTLEETVRTQITPN